jgi:secondary thiamine-phosphate synthase enzyme
VRQHAHSITVVTQGKGLYEFTLAVDRWVSSLGLITGLVTLFLTHTSASLLIQENADPDVVMDLNDFFSRIAPENPSLYRHTAEGADDMPAHIRAALTNVDLNIPIRSGRLALGTWQGIYLFEHRRLSHRRTVLLHAIGE